MKLFKLLIAIYLMINIIWLALKATKSIKIEPIWTVYYYPVGWGLLVIVRYWFFVRSDENLCRMKEKMIETRIK